MKRRNTEKNEETKKKESIREGDYKREDEESKEGNLLHSDNHTATWFEFSEQWISADHSGRAV
jgi:hypothetical protein